MKCAEEATLMKDLGAWTALDLFNRMRAHLGSARLRWLAVAAGLFCVFWVSQVKGSDAQGDPSLAAPSGASGPQAVPQAPRAEKV